ncbi:hypothetical protein FQA39_LY07619 [Lamprigera yunnana]|nr:hypothetical protein FQA39_LY07619 [Lamprigera yunnana]
MSHSQPKRVRPSDPNFEEVVLEWFNADSDADAICSEHSSDSEVSSLSSQDEDDQDETFGADGYNITNTNTPRRNITTVINIHNIINNTNIIDIPIDVNNTNINNITISDRSNDEEEEEEGEEDEQSYAKEYDKCCYIYSPRKCSKLDTYPFFKCVQERKKVCGNICISPIIHEQPYRHCHPSNTGLSCQEKTMYVPQPQPSCSYQQAWPYVMCGNPQPTYCGGCYQHYNFQPTLVGCPYYCYDDGYRQGSLYRKGPFYRPGYSHIPSCYQTATCAPNYNNYFAYPNSGYPANPYPNPGFAYPPNSYPNTGQVYPPNSYPPRVIVHQNSSSNSTKNSTSINKSPFPSYYNIPLFPPYISTGYQYPRSPPVYILPPEVDIQAIITHPENENRYAQITINKPDNEEEPFEDEDVD